MLSQLSNVSAASSSSTSIDGGHELVPRSSTELVDLGARLQAMLAKPGDHTIGAFAALVERLGAELAIAQPTAHNADADFSVLFERSAASREPLDDASIALIASSIVGDTTV